MCRKMILLVLSIFSVIYCDEIVVWQAFSQNVHNTNVDVIVEPFNLQGRVTASNSISSVEVVFYRYEAQTRKNALDVYFKEKNDAIFQGKLTFEANETDILIVAHLEGGKKLEKKMSLAPSRFITNTEFEDYDSITAKKIHRDTITDMAFTRNNRYLISGGDDNYTYIMDAKTLKVVRSLRGYVESLAITPDDKYVLTGGKDGNIRVWEIKTGKRLKVFRAHKNAVNTIAISNSGKYAISGSLNSRVALWDLATHKKVMDYPDSSTTREYLSAIFTSDDRYTIIGDSRNKATIFDATEGTYIKSVSGSGPITSLAMTRNMRHLYTGDTTGRVKWSRSLLQPHVDDPSWREEYNLLWTAFFQRDQIEIDDYSSSKAYYKIYYGHPIRGYSSPIVYMNTSGDGKYVMYVAEEGAIRISEIETGFKRYSTALYKHHRASAGAFSFDGKLAAIGELNGKINLYGLP
ncbi:WD40 repeat domain-containing protein [Candidatus Uabimicrobium amorphum]|uniref:Anaphase-promoting complex subunit 4 WD40 domain-containing protein n=1 Tax=Uabimicrobium amorphum TaxID=2596890 RepID=A0A5S9IHF6_UABAM|nr:hypothetical protein [Candidatus Uabimicrobium amorphum]BBM81868.1 hypothetical protein UABAM_00210 [Candidatus Uabimicrobium amorphum]